MTVWLKALVPMLLEWLPQAVQWRLAAVTLLLRTAIWAMRQQPQRAGMLCAAGLVLVLLVRSWPVG